MALRLYAAALALVLCAVAADAKPLRLQILNCDNGGKCTTYQAKREQSQQTFSARRTTGERYDVKFIPNPPGTWRVAKSCAHRLAAYWGLGKGLDLVATWRRVFARASGPGVGIAAVRHGNGHIMGIIGGGPGAWRVADFNSGDHRNREYTVSNFRGYYFVDPRVKVAGQ